MNIAINTQKIESIDTKKISEKDLNKIFELEQDMWAHWLWEYLVCNWCWEIYSKKDIFWHLNDDIYFETVWKIEKILWLKTVSCKVCWEETEHMFWKNYINDILERYNETDSYLTIYRDNTWEIRGFTDWYVSDLKSIFDREFKNYYSDIWIEKIKSFVKWALLWIIPDKFLLCCSIWLEWKYRNNQVLFELYRLFHKNVVDTWNGNLIWIYEAVIWSRMQKLYSAFWAQQIWVSDKYIDLKQNTSKKYKSDIFIHYMMSRIFSERLKYPIINI